ncbi:MAG TPA: DUF4142 domain-containing protein [Syntrophales bacterium]|nr:DUF4142 domain-containing protein [Syntrophales bacterium]
MKWTGKLCFIALAASMCLCIALALAQSGVKIKADGDARFLQDAFASCSWKLAIGNLALRQAASKETKKFTELMIADQDQICRDLKNLSDRKGITLSEDRDIVRQNTITFMSKEYGAAFDRLYVSLMVDEHQRDVVLYRDEAEKGRDDDIKAFAGKFIKRLEEYVGMAKKILVSIPQPMLK